MSIPAPISCSPSLTIYSTLSHPHAHQEKCRVTSLSVQSATFTTWRAWSFRRAPQKSRAFYYTPGRFGGRLDASGPLTIRPGAHTASALLNFPVHIRRSIVRPMRQTPVWRTKACSRRSPVADVFSSGRRPDVARGRLVSSGRYLDVV